MSQCPVCHAPLKDDFGLTECGGCGAQLIVHMDGRVEYQGAEEALEEVPEEVPQESDVNFSDEEVPREIDLDIPEEPTQMRTVVRQDLVPPEGEGTEHQMPEDDLYGEVGLPPPVPEKEFLGAPNPDLFPEFDGAEPEAAPAAVYNSGNEVSDSPDLADVASFGNSEVSGGREGPLRYNLFIEGIDTSDVREAFREALTDRKLMWDTDQILRSVRNGRVNIPNVAPLKAHILINRLRGMPVQVRWEQYAISQI